MCGIAGFYGVSARWAIPPQVILRRMVSAIRHRGPDDWGLHVEGRVGLGHARLSIIDPSGGRQPMSDEDGSFWITYNGEVFNYPELREELTRSGECFRTTSDTEVVLRAFRRKGPDAVVEFNGDFAFAVWDRRHDRLVLARDRMGVRPVYYALTDGVLVFGSEVKALLQVPGLRAEIDPQALSQCFTFWSPRAPRTAFKGIQELPPGHLLVADHAGVSVRPYWQPSYPAHQDASPGRQTPPASPVSSMDAAFGRAHRDEEDLAQELRALLSDATRIRLRADVPVGAYLSGGLDSSAVSALAGPLAGGGLRTFSVRFEASEFDEGPFQHRVARALGCEHESVLVTAREIGSLFPEVVRHAERPLLRTAPAPLLRLAGLVRGSSFKVVLTGEGADELFGGYDLFKEDKVRRFWSRQPRSPWRPRLLRRLYPYLAGLRGQPQAYLEAFFKVGLDRPHDPLFSHLPRWATTTGIHRFLSDDLLASLKGYDPAQELRDSLPPAFSTWHPLSRAQYLETALLLPGYILSAQGDRVAMAHGVEGRFPFLDPRVVDFAAALPPRLKLRGLTEKYLLRRSVGPLLPPEIARRPKQPYRAPDGESFFAGGCPDYVGELLSPGALAASGYFDPRAVGMLVRKCHSGAAGSRDNMALVGILSVQLLDRLFVRGATAATPPGPPPLPVRSPSGGDKAHPSAHAC